MMSGGETRQTPLPKGQFRDRAESERQRKTHGPRMVTYILNCPPHAQNMHISSRQDCILFHTPLSGGHSSRHIFSHKDYNHIYATPFGGHVSHSSFVIHVIFYPGLLQYRLTVLLGLLGSSGTIVINLLLNHVDLTGLGEILPASSAIMRALCPLLIPSVLRGTSCTRQSYCVGLFLNAYNGTATRPLFLARDLSTCLHPHGYCASYVWSQETPDKLLLVRVAVLSFTSLVQAMPPYPSGCNSLTFQLKQDPKWGLYCGLLAVMSHYDPVVEQDSSSSLQTSRSIQAGLRSSHGFKAHHILLSQLRQEPKRGPAFVLDIVYRHVVMYVGLTQKGQNGTAVLTDTASRAIKPRGHSPTSPLIVTGHNHLGTVSFIHSVSKLGWDLQQGFLTICRSKLMRVAPGEPFLPFPREGVG